MITLLIGGRYSNRVMYFNSLVIAVISEMNCILYDKVDAFI